MKPLTGPGGRLMWLRTSKIPLRNTQGQIIGVFGTFEDITEKKRAEEALRCRVLYRTMAQSIPGGAISVVDELALRGGGGRVVGSDWPEQANHAGAHR